MKTRLNRRSYSRFASAKAFFTAASASAMLRCSCADHSTDCFGGGCSARDSPIRGWLWNASCQSGVVRLRQTSLDATSKDASSVRGLRAAIPCAHAREPQQGKIVLIASSLDKAFHFVKTSFASRKSPPDSSALSRVKNSTTRLPATAARYLAVERISSIGWISEATACLAKRSRSALII